MIMQGTYTQIDGHMYVVAADITNVFRALVCSKLDTLELSPLQLAHASPSVRPSASAPRSAKLKKKVCKVSRRRCSRFLVRAGFEGAKERRKEVAAATVAARCRPAGHSQLESLARSLASPTRPIEKENCSRVAAEANFDPPEKFVLSGMLKERPTS